MAQISKIYTYQTMPGIDPDIGLKIDQEIAQIINTVNSLDDANIDGNPKIAESKLNLSSGSYLPTAGGDLTNTIWHKFSGLWRKMGANTGATGRVYEYRDLSNGILWGIAYNTYYSGGWQQRDVADICARLEITVNGSGASALGAIRAYFAPYAASGAPVWYPAQYIMPVCGTGSLGDVTATTDTVSGLLQYNALIIPDGVTWTLTQGRPLIIRARESVIINGILDGNGKGARGGASNISTSPGANGSFGSGGGSGLGGDAGGIGGQCTFMQYTVPGGVADGGVGNAPVITYMIPSDLGYLGGGGGGGAYRGAGGGFDIDGAGGNGGGFIYIESPSITIGSTGIVRCNGQNGFNSTAGNYGGGGGGGGGGIYLRGLRISQGGSISVIGGTGGTEVGTGTPGGAGGAGLSYIEELR